MLSAAKLLAPTRCGRQLCKIGRRSEDIYVIHMFFVKWVGLRPSGVNVYVFTGIYAAVVVLAVALLSGKILERFRLYRFSLGRF